MLGAIVGDIVGSVYEFNNHRSKDFPLFQESSHFTDDTILTIATADALMTDCDFETKYREYGRKYPSSYGNRFQDWIDGVIDGPLQQLRQWLGHACEPDWLVPPSGQPGAVPCRKIRRGHAQPP